MNNECVKMTSRQACEYLYEVGYLREVSGFHACQTDDTGLEIYCPNGKVLYNGREYNATNPTVFIENQEIVLPLLEMARDSGCGMVLNSSIVI